MLCKLWTQTLYELNSVFKVLFQIFPAVSQSTLETRFTTTITIHQNLALWSSRYSDKIVTTAKNGVFSQQGHTFDKNLEESKN